jgi:hypothetical protein
VCFAETPLQCTTAEKHHCSCESADAPHAWLNTAHVLCKRTLQAAPLQACTGDTRIGAATAHMRGGTSESSGATHLSKSAWPFPIYPALGK